MAQWAKNLPANAGGIGDAGLIPGLGRSLEEEVSTTPVFLPRESHGQRSLAGPRSCKELDTADYAHASPLTRIMLSKLKAMLFLGPIKEQREQSSATSEPGER